MIYRFTDNNRSKEVISALDSELEHLKRSQANPKIILKLEDAISIIKTCQTSNPNNYLNQTLSQREVALPQATCIRLGINPLSATLLNKYIKNEGALLLEKTLPGKEGHLLSMITKSPTSAEDWINIRDLITELCNQQIVKAGNAQNQQSTQRTKRQSTIEKQILIDQMARELLDQYPNLKRNKEALASEVSDKLKGVGINLKESTIRRDYLKKHPNY